MRLFPRSEDFHKYFEGITRHILTAAELLHQMATEKERSAELGKQIKDLEHECDGITHETMRKLDTTFITPFDREDIHALVSRLDDVIDNIDVAASRIVLYEIPRPSKELEALTSLLRKATTVVASAISKFRDLKNSKETMGDLIEINRIEDEGDQAMRAALVSLFKNIKDPFELIKLKEVIEDVENAIDRCEDVANVIESVIVKNA